MEKKHDEPVDIDDGTHDMAQLKADATLQAKLSTQHSQKVGSR